MRWSWTAASLTQTRPIVILSSSCRFYGPFVWKLLNNRQQFWIRCTCWRSTQVDMPFKKNTAGRVGVLRGSSIWFVRLLDFQLFETWMTLSSQFCCKKDLSLLVSTHHGRCLFELTLLEMSAVLTQTVSPSLARSLHSLSLCNGCNWSDLGLGFFGPYWTSWNLSQQSNALQNFQVIN